MDTPQWRFGTQAWPFLHCKAERILLKRQKSSRFELFCDGRSNAAVRLQIKRARNFSTLMTQVLSGCFWRIPRRFVS
jgi:hypothetical protein